MALQSNSTDNHVAALELKHRTLKQKIAEAIAHPATDDLELAELKRRKLQLKDRLEQIRHSDSHH